MPAPIEAGLLRHRVTIQQLVETRNAEGEPISSWTSLAVRWARIEPLSGREIFIAQQVQAQTTHKVLLRYYKGLAPGMRFQYMTRVFQITDVTSADEITDRMECMCTELSSRVLFTFVGLPSNVRPGSGFGFTVLAQDQFNHTLVNYSGTVAFTCSDSLATLPAAATLTSGAGSFSATLQSGGSQTLTATDTASSSITGSGGPVVCALYLFVQFGPTITAGSATAGTVTALTINNVPDTTYTGTVLFTSGDPYGLLPTGSTLTAGVGHFSITLKTAGSRVLTATDSQNGTITGHANLQVSGPGFYAMPSWDNANTSSLYISVSPGNDGVAFSAVSITYALGYTPPVFRDHRLCYAFGRAYVLSDTADTNSLTTYFGILSTDGQCDSSGNVIWNPVGDGKIDLTVIVPGIQAGYNPTFLFDDDGSMWLYFVANTDGNFDHNVAYAAKCNNTAALRTSNTKPTFDAAVLLTGDGVFTPPVGESDIYIDHDPGGPYLWAYQGVDQIINVVRAQSLTGPYSYYLMANWLALPTVKSTFNPLTTLDGTMRRVYLDNRGSPPGGQYTQQAAGVGDWRNWITESPPAFSALATVTTPQTSTPRSIGPIPISGSLDHFKVACPANVGAHQPLIVTVTALDISNFIAFGYTGTVHFTATDGAAVFPSGGSLTKGVGVFSVTLRTAGSQTITAADTATPTIIGSASSTVAAGVADFAVAMPGIITAGVQFVVTVTAFNADGTVNTGYGGTVQFTSSDANASTQLPAGSSLTSGVGIFSATLTTAGTQTLSASDATTPSVTGRAAILVGFATMSKIGVTLPSTGTAGVTFGVTATALDAYNNTVTSWFSQPTWSFTTTAAAGPSGKPVNGVLSTTAKYNSVGLANKTFTATDSLVSSRKGSASMVISAAAATHFTFIAPSTATGGVGFKITVNALDAFSNLATGYTGTMHLTATDTGAILPPNSTFTAGRGIMSVTLSTAGAQTLTATDTVTSSITGHSNTITVAAGTGTYFVLTMSGNNYGSGNGNTFSITATAKNSNGSTNTGYTGNATLSTANGNNESDPFFLWTGGGFPGSGGPFVAGVFVYTGIYTSAGGGGTCQFQVVDNSDNTINGISQVVTFN
jgi:SPP1 family predicted phage head-tail adaptor